jgi:mannan endo-1,4-beta-mannosidase
MTPFVVMRDARLSLDGQPFSFLGTNCYFLQEEGAREALGWEGYAGRVDEALRKVAGLGLTVVRAWAFNDDPDNPAAMQTAPGEYSDAGFRGMDLAIAAAQRHGVKLLLSLGNFWGDYGGVPQYLRWHGRDSRDTDAFFTDPGMRTHYAEHIEHVVGRRNHLTGVRWADDPTILGWELMNEPRSCSRSWVAELGGRLRAATRQLVLTGEEGLSPSFAENSAQVDVASIHLYPDEWGWDLTTCEAAGVAWIRDHADAAARVGRPTILGEFGLSNRGPLSLRERRSIYGRWLDAAREHPNVVGACSWSFSTDDRPDQWDAYSWTWRDGTRPEDDANRYAALHRDEAARWA